MSSSKKASGSKENVAEFVESFAPYNPFCRFQSTPGEAFPAPCGVTQRDGVSGGIEANLMSARMRAGATGTGVNITRVTRSLHPIHKLDERTRRRIFLSNVMDLPGPGAVFFFIGEQLGCFAHQTREDVDPDRKIRTPDQGALVCFDERFGFSQMILPGRGADDDRD